MQGQNQDTNNNPKPQGSQGSNQNLNKQESNDSGSQKPNQNLAPKPGYNPNMRPPPQGFPPGYPPQGYYNPAQGQAYPQQGYPPQHGGQPQRHPGQPIPGQDQFPQQYGYPPQNPNYYPGYPPQYGPPQGYPGMGHQPYPPYGGYPPGYGPQGYPHPGMNPAFGGPGPKLPPGAKPIPRGNPELQPGQVHLGQGAQTPKEQPVSQQQINSQKKLPEPSASKPVANQNNQPGQPKPALNTNTGNTVVNTQQTKPQPNKNNVATPIPVNPNPNQNQNQAQKPRDQPKAQAPKNPVKRSSSQQDPEVDDEGFPIPRKLPEFLEGALTGNAITPAQEKILNKFHTLDRGTYFIDQNQKTLHFMIQSNLDFVGWVDDYMINGYILNGLIVKVKTLTTNVYLFIEPEHEIYKKYVSEENGKLRWSDSITNEMQIISITKIEKVEVYDNVDDSFEGFICYIITEDSQLAMDVWPVHLQGWIELRSLLILFEPTSIRKIYLDSLQNELESPESNEFNGKRISCIINPDLPGETIKFSKRMTYALEKKCIVGSLSCQFGIYTLMAEQANHMQQFADIVEKALDIAEELGAYVMITNLRRTFDYDGKTVLYLPSDPTLKILRYDRTLTFSTKCKKSISLN